MNRENRNENRRDMRQRSRDDESSAYETRSDKSTENIAKERAAYQFDQYGNTVGDSYNFGGGYGDMRNQGSETISRGKGRHYDEGTSRNYGNMGSYGGAQGFGSSRSGYASQHPDQEFGYDSASGHGSAGYNQEPHRHEGRDRQIYGGYRDDNSYSSHASRSASGRNSSSNEGSRSNWPQQQQGYGRRSEGRGQQEGNTSGGAYMGSGYDRTTRGEYGPMTNAIRNEQDYGAYNSTQNRSRGYATDWSSGPDFGRMESRDFNRGYEGPRSYGRGNEGRNDYGRGYDPGYNRGYDRGWGERYEENYGNMAGSLSWGSDRDWTSEDQRHYDPLSGRYRHSTRDDNPYDEWGNYRTRW